MAKATTRNNSTIATLKRENQRLALKNARLERRLMATKQSKRNKNPNFWRHVAMYVCIVLAGATLVASNFLFWVGRSVLDNKQFNSTMSRVVKEPSVQQAVAQYTTTQIFNSVDTQAYITQVLPPRAEFLAPTLSAQIKTATQSMLQKLMESPKFQDLWINTTSDAHARILNYIEHYQGNGTISLNDIYQKLSANLQDTKLSFLTNKQLPAKAGSITVVQASWLPTAHRIVTVAPYMKWVASVLFIGFSVLAVWLSGRRRRMVITLAVLLGVMMLLTSVAARVTPSIVAQNVNADYQAAVKDVTSALLQPLIIQTRTLLSLSLLSIVIAWISGNYKSAVNTRRRVSQLAEGKIHSAIFAKDNKFTKWVGSHRRVLQWTSVIIISGIMLSVRLSPALVGAYALLMLALVLIVEVLAAPAKK